MAIALSPLLRRSLSTLYPDNEEVFEPLPGPVAPQEPVEIGTAPVRGDVEEGMRPLDGNPYRVKTRVAAQRNGVNPDVLERMYNQESRFDPTAYNEASGASGIAQLMPETAAELGVDPRDPDASIDAGARYLRRMQDYFDGDQRKAIAAYNWGPGNVEKAVRQYGADWEQAAPEETKHYLSVVGGGTGYANRESALVQGYDAPSAPAKGLRARLFDGQPATGGIDPLTGAPYGADYGPATQGAQQANDAFARLAEQGIDGDDYFKSAKRSLDRQVRRFAEPATQAVGDAIDAGAIPGSPIFNWGRDALGLEDRVPSAGEIAAPFIVPQDATDVALTVGPGNALKGIKGVRGLLKGGSGGLGIIAKNGKQLDNAMAETLRIANEAKDAVLARGGTPAEARQAAAAAMREAQTAAAAVDDVTLATDRAVARDPYTNTGKGLRAKASEMAARMAGDGPVASVVPNERPKTTWNITRKDGSQYVAETLAGAPSSSPEEAAERLAAATDDWERTRDARRASQAQGRADMAREGIEKLKGAGPMKSIVPTQVRRSGGPPVELPEAGKTLRIDAGDTQVLFKNHGWGVEDVNVVEVSVFRSTARGSVQARNSQGSDLRALREAGEIINEFRMKYPDDILMARPTDPRRARIYEMAGFRKPTEWEIKQGNGLENPRALVLGEGIDSRPSALRGGFTDSPADVAARNAAADRMQAREVPSGARDVVADIAGLAKKAGDPASLVREWVFGEGSEPAAGNAATKRQPVPDVTPVQTRFPGDDFAPPAPEKAHWLNLDNVLGALGAPRSVMTTADFGNIGRQNLPLNVRHPDVGVKVVQDTIAAFKSEEAAQAAKQAVEASPLHKDATEKYGLKLWSWGEGIAAGERVPGYESLNSSVVSKWVSKFPFMRNSERAMATGQNVQGMRVFEKWAEPILANPNLSEADKTKRLTDLAGVINHWRGFSGTRAANWLSNTGALFSGQYTVSRGQVLVDPIVMALRGSPEARNLAAQTLLSFAGSNAAMLALMAATGEKTGKWSVNANPLDGDFGQLRIGNTRFDTLAGLGPVMKTVSRMSALAADGTFGTEWAKEGDKLGSVLLRFFENKEQPIARMITDGLLHNKLPKPEEMKNLIMPMLASGIIDAIREGENPAIVAASTVASAVGIGANTYTTAEDALGADFDTLSLPDKLKRLESVPDEQQRQAKQIVRKEYNEALKAAGYDHPSANSKALDRKNPHLDVQGWALDRGTLQSIDAVEQAMKADLGRDVRLEGLKRAVNQDENSKKAWEASKKPIDWYLNDVVPQNADKFIEAYSKQKDGELYKKRDGTLLTFEQLPPGLQSKVSTAIKAQALTPEMHAWLAWWGNRELPKGTTGEAALVRTEFDKITSKYGRKEPETLTKAVLAGIAASN